VQQLKVIATWNSDRDLWETDQTSLFEHLAVYSETWPTSGMTRNGTAYSLPTSEHHTGATGSSSLLPTPDAYAGKRGGSQHPDKRRAGGHSVNLSDVVEHKLLPTPRAQNGQDMNQQIWARPLDQPQNLENALATVLFRGTNTKQPSLNGETS
jgi:hypothetical protein